MCSRCDVLEEEVAFLKSELGLQAAADRVHTLRRELRMRPGVAALVLRLYDAKGRLVTKAQCVEAIPAVWADREERSDTINNVYVSHARQALGKTAIETCWGEGFRMTETGRAKVAEILGRVA